MNYLKNILPLFILMIVIGLQAQTITVVGNVYSQGGYPMPNINVTAKVGTQTLTTTTDEEGNYSLVDVPRDANFSLTPVNTLNPLNGISTFDIVLGSKHILGLQPFDSAGKYLAMDVNRSGSVTVLDLALIRRLILGLSIEIPGTTAWRFIEEKQIEMIMFDQTKMPEYNPELPDMIFTINDDNSITLNFIGIKIGDANGSVTSEF